MRPKDDIHTFPPGTRLAFDENIANKIMGCYARSGCMIVYVAPKGSPDEEWLATAWEKGAEVVISFDLDIPNIIEKEKYDMDWREP